MITKQEKAAIEKSAELWNLLIELPQGHPDDINDLRFHIHAIQNIILARSTQRVLQEAANG